MKKKLFIVVSISIFMLLVFGLIYKNYSINKRYEIMKKELGEEATKYLKISHPYCTPGSESFTINENTLLVQFAMDKKKLLDIDKKNYCKARIEVMCIAVNELDIDVYIKCKDYEDKNYSNWKNEK